MKERRKTEPLMPIVERREVTLLLKWRSLTLGQTMPRLVVTIARVRMMERVLMEMPGLPDAIGGCCTVVVEVGDDVGGERAVDVEGALHQHHDEPRDQGDHLILRNHGQISCKQYNPPYISCYHRK